MSSIALALCYDSYVWYEQPGVVRHHPPGGFFGSKGKRITQVGERKRISTSMETKTREAQTEADIYAQVQQSFAEFDDPAHGWEHIKRVYQLALHIAEQEDADRFIVGTAALLHDIGRLTHDTKQHHAEISESLASELLSAYPITP